MFLGLEDIHEDHNLVSENLMIIKQVVQTNQQEDNHLLL